MTATSSNLFDTFVWFICFARPPRIRDFFSRCIEDDDSLDEFPQVSLCGIDEWIPDEYGKTFATKIANFIMAAQVEEVVAFIKSFKVGKPNYRSLKKFDEYRKEVGYEIGEIDPSPEWLVLRQQGLLNYEDDENNAFDES